MANSSLREAIKKRDGYVCVQCGSIEELTIDHIIPRIRGGDDRPTNLQTLCASCNKEKSNHPHSRWQAIKNWLSGNNQFMKLNYQIQVRVRKAMRQLKDHFAQDITKLQNNQADLLANQRKLRDLLEDTQASYAQLLNLHTALSGKHDKLLEYLEISWENILVEGYAPKPKPKPRVKKPIKEERSVVRRVRQSNR